MKEIVVSGHTVRDDALEEIFETTGGPGGQHANRNETAVRLRLDLQRAGLPKELTSRLMDRLGATAEVRSAESRSQFRNRSIARRQLEEVLSEAAKVAQERKPTKPTRASKRRRLADKRARGEKKRLRRSPPLDD